MFSWLQLLLGLTKLYPTTDSLRIPSLCFSALPLLLLGCLSDSDKSNPGDSNPDSSAILRGAIQKGPFAGGSEVRAVLLDTMALSTGTSFEGATDDDFGSFRIPLKKTGLFELTSTGTYFNEIIGTLSSAPLTLRAVVHIPPGDSTTAYVNAVTHMISRRAKKLIAGGMSSDSAISQADRELRDALPLYQPPAAKIIPAASLDLLGADAAPAQYALALSFVLLRVVQREGASTSEFDSRLQKLLNDIALELEADGSLQAATVSRLVNAGKDLYPPLVMANLSSWLKGRRSDRLPANPNQVLDTDGDGVVNSGDPDVDGDLVPDSLDCDAYDPSIQAGHESVVCAPLTSPAPTTSPGDREIKVDWKSDLKAASFQIYYHEGSSFDPDIALKIDSVLPGYVIRGVANGKKHVVVLKVQYGSLYSKTSPPAFCIPIVSPSLRVSSDPDRMVLEWQHQVGVSYNLFIRKDNPSDSQEFTRINFTGKVFTSPQELRDGDLIHGATYSFYLQAWNETGYLASSVVSATYKRSAHIVGDSTLPVNSIGTYSPLTIGPGGKPWLAYKFLNGAIPSADVLRFDGSVWISQSMSASKPALVSVNHVLDLKVDRNGIPYLLYNVSANRAMVARLSSNGWETLGGKEFAIEHDFEAWLDLGDSLIPFICYSELSHRLTVAKFQGGEWQSVGAPEFSSGIVRSNPLRIERRTSFRVSKEGIPYVAYQNDGRITVMRLGASGWEHLGKPSFAPLLYDVSLAVLDSNQVFVSCRSGASAVSVYSYTSGAWASLFSGNIRCNQLSMQVSNQGIPIIGYVDANYYRKGGLEPKDVGNLFASVRKIENGVISFVGQPGLTPGRIGDYRLLTFALAEGGRPYIAYQADVFVGYSRPSKIHVITVDP